MMKLKEKISGTFRGVNASKKRCHLRSYISTAGKNGLGVLDALADALKGNPFIPERVGQEYDSLQRPSAILDKIY